MVFRPVRQSITGIWLIGLTLLASTLVLGLSPTVINSASSTSTPTVGPSTPVTNVRAAAKVRATAKVRAAAKVCAAARIPAVVIPAAVIPDECCDGNNIEQTNQCEGNEGDCERMNGCVNLKQCPPDVQLAGVVAFGHDRNYNSCLGNSFDDVSVPGGSGFGMVGARTRQLLALVPKSVNDIAFLFHPGAGFGATVATKKGKVQQGTPQPKAQEPDEPVGGASRASMSGFRWQSSSLSNYLYELPSAGVPGNVEYYVSASSKLLFKSTGTNAAPAYQPPPDRHLELTRSGAGMAEIYTLTDNDSGEVRIFYGINGQIDSEKRGRMKELTTRALREEGSGEGEEKGTPGLRYTYNSDGLVSMVTTSEMNQISYSYDCLLYTSPSPRDKRQSRMPSSA